MRRAIGIGVVGALAALSSVAGSDPVSAAPVSATATGVELQLAGACGANPQVLISGEGIGDGFGEFGALTLLDDPPPVVSITPSTLFDDWAFADSPFGFVAPTVPSAGDLVGGYAIVGDPGLQVAAEWFVLWQCGAGPDSATVVSTCVGAYGSCPSSVGEARAVDATVAPGAAAPGETFTVTMTGCVGGLVAAGLFIPFAADPIASTGPLASSRAPVVATITVPSSAASTDGATVVVMCSNAAGVVVLPVRIVSAPVTTVVAAPATPTGSAPTFTG